MLQKELWISDIEKVLHEDAAFLSTMRDLSAYVTGYTVHVPQAGDTGAILIDTAASAPVQRVDDEITFRVRNFSTPSLLVTELESFQLSYDKRKDAMEGLDEKLIETVGDTVLANLAASTSAINYQVKGATLSFADMTNIAKAFDDQKVAKRDRTIVLPNDMFYELQNDPTVAHQYANGFDYSVVQSGKLATVAGIQILQRHTVAKHNGTDAAVAYAKQSAGYALKNIDFMIDSGDNGNGNPALGGVVLRAFLWLGSAGIRKDGIVNVVR